MIAIGKRPIGLRFHYCFRPARFCCSCCFSRAIRMLDQGRRGALAFRIARFGEALKMRDHFCEVHDIGIFVVQVEEVDLMVEERAVKGALFHDHAVEAVGIGVNRTGAHTARCAFAANDQTLGASRRRSRSGVCRKRPSRSL